MTDELHPDGTARWTVLVVEDDPLSRDLLEQMLADHGFRVISASNGAEAIERVRDTVPVLVITDMSMPEMDGFELCARLKGDPRTQNVPVVFVSATGAYSRQRLAEGVGGEGFLAKPLLEEDVIPVASRLSVAHLRGQGGP